MATLIEANLLGNGLKIAIIVARFNNFITERLLEGALDALNRHGVMSDDVQIVKVPGTFEIPVIARKLAASGKFNAVICLGAVIRGGTPHFDYVAAEVSKGVAAAALETGVPVLFGVLTCDTLEQAIERAGVKNGNKGYEAAVAAVEMGNLCKLI